MLRVLTQISFTQQPTAAMPARNGTINYNFVHEFEVESTWKNLTDGGSITLPKNVFITDKNKNRFSLAGTNINLGGFSNTAPVFLRGDKVVISWGYAELNATLQVVFEGYISQVTSKKPFVVHVEDNMYLLKQVPAAGGNNGYFASSKYTVETMLAEMISNGKIPNSNKPLPFTVNTTTSTSLGNYIAQNETIAEVLARLRKDFHFEAYFRGNELRCGSFVYLEQDAINDGQKVFTFQKNIISDDLDYKRKDDVTLSAVATNTIEQTTGKTTKDGQAKTKKQRLEVLVTFLNGSDTATVNIITPTNKLPPNTGGERRTLHFLGATTTAQLTTLATNELRKYYYTGFRGHFTTFGTPFVRHGDNVDILDPILPERNGRYKVKSVKYKGGVAGLRQEIELAYLITRLDSAGKPIV